MINPIRNVVLITRIKSQRLVSLVLLFLFASIVLSEEAPDHDAKASFPSAESYINFNFDQVGILEFVKVVGEVTGKKFVLGHGVTGEITVISPKVKAQNVYPLFLSILESAGCSVVEDREVLYIVKVTDHPILVGSIVGVGEETPITGLVTKIFIIKHVTAAALRKLIESKVNNGRDGAVHSIDETNHLIVTDTVDNIRKIDRLIEEIDLPGLARTIEVVPLSFANALDLSRELNEAMADFVTRGERLRNRLPPVTGAMDDVRRRSFVIASPHANMLLLVGSIFQIEQLKSIISRIDVDRPSGEGGMNAIFLSYLSAEEAAKNLKALLEDDGIQPVGHAAKRRIAIEADVSNKALLVDASPRDFEAIHKLVKQLDRAPLQVHIEVLIAEITIGDSFELGMTMVGGDIPGYGEKTLLFGNNLMNKEEVDLLNLIQNKILPGGLTVGFPNGSKLDSDGNTLISYPGIININAIKEDSRFNIRANPSIVTLNNREASINIANDIPILTSIIEGGAGTTRDIIQNIERMDVGIKLSLTPHIITNGFVQMDLNPRIEAVIDPGRDDIPFTPTIAKREASTSVIVRDGELIVIAGLTRKDKVNKVKKFPLLGSIPLIGWIFRHNIQVMEKTNLLIFVTPTVLGDDIDSAVLVDKEVKLKGILPNER